LDIPAIEQKRHARRSPGPPVHQTGGVSSRAGDFEKPPYKDLSARMLKNDLAKVLKCPGAGDHNGNSLI